MKQIKKQYRKISKFIGVLTLILFIVLSTLQLPIRANGNQPITLGKIQGTGAIVSKFNEYGYESTANWDAIDKISVNGEIAFCVEPLVIGLGGTYSRSDFDINTQRTLSRIVYYGWATSPKTDNDYAVTQYMIWEALGATITKWLGSFGNIYSTLKVQVQSKIDNHEKRPSFHGASGYEVNVNETISFYDDNYVINQLHIVDNGGTNAWIENNQLHILPNVNTPDNTTIILQKVLDEHVGVSIAYRSSNGQDVGIFKISDPLPSIVTIKVNKFGSLEITKFDEEHNLIPNTSYKLSYNADMSNPIGIYTTGADGKIRIDNLQGNTVVYYQEVDVPSNLVIDSTINSVTIPVNDVVSVSQMNKIQKGRITTKKVDKDTGVAHGDATLQGAVYYLYANTDIVNPITGSVIHPAGTFMGERTTDENGNMESFDNLYLGSYYLQEHTASYGYELNDEKLIIDLNYAGQTENLVVESVTSQETIKRGQFSLSKGISQSDNSEIMKPEVGAEFITVLKKYVDKYGSIEAAYEHKDEYATDEYDLLVTDKQGNAQSKKLAFGTYVSKQVKGDEESVLLNQTWETMIDGDKNNEKHYIIKNQLFQPYVKIIKKDKETGQIVTFSDGTYKIRNVDTGDYLTQKVGNKYISEFKTENGYVVLPLKVSAGNYELIEIVAPDGYTIEKTPIPFKISQTNIHETDEDGEPVYIVEISNQRVKGNIIVYKEGEVLDNYITNEYGDIQFTYRKVRLANTDYNLIAKEDIQSAIDGSVLFKKGAVVATGTTDDNGVIEFSDLELGNYYVQEVKASHGMVLDDTKYTVELTYDNSDTEIVTKELALWNERQKYTAAIKKLDDENLKYLAGAEFTLYANRDIYNYDQEVIVPAGTALQTIVSSGTGSAEFTLDLPTDLTDPYKPMPIDIRLIMGYEVVDGVELYGDPNSLFVVKETKAPYSYQIKEANLYVDTTYRGQDESYVMITHEITNPKIKVDIQVNKVDINTQQFITNQEFSFGIYSNEKCTKLLEKAYANTDAGTATFKGISYGTYFIKEIEAPLGYVLSEEIVKVDINEDGVFVNGQKVEGENEVYSFVYYNDILPIDVETGDNSHTNFFIALLSSSILCLISLAMERKANSYEE